MLRLATGIPLGLLMVLLFGFPRTGTPHLLLICLLPLTVLMLAELFRLQGLVTSNGRLTREALVGCTFGGLLLILAHTGHWLLFPAWSGLFLVALLLPGLRHFPLDTPILRVPSTIFFSTLWVAGGLAACCGLRDLGEAWMDLAWLPAIAFNPVSLLPVFGAWCYDSCALGTGAATGTLPMAPHISPKKSWEGFAGGLMGGAVGMMGLVWITERLAGDAWVVPVSAWPVAAVLGAFFGACSQCGDLLVSCLKREAHVKDSAQLIPSQGGLMDKGDGFLLVSSFALGLLYCFTLLAHPRSPV